jgi:hypothetical protein
VIKAESDLEREKTVRFVHKSILAAPRAADLVASVSRALISSPHQCGIARY